MYRKTPIIVIIKPTVYIGAADTATTHSIFTIYYFYPTTAYSILTLSQKWKSSFFFYNLFLSVVADENKKLVS